MKDNNIFSDSLCEVISNKREVLIENNSAHYVINVNPILRLYCYKDKAGFRFFEEEEDLVYFYSKYASKDSEVYVSEFLGDVFGCTDVIRRVFLDGSYQICALRDIDSYSVMNLNEFVSSNQVIWDFQFGSLREECIAFKRKGIEFRNDVYFERDVYDRFKDYAKRKVL